MIQSIKNCSLTDIHLDSINNLKIITQHMLSYLLKVVCEWVLRPLLLYPDYHISRSDSI